MVTEIVNNLHAPLMPPEEIIAVYVAITKNTTKKNVVVFALGVSVVSCNCFTI